VGASTGTLIGERLPERFRQTVMHAVGLMTLLIGFQMALGTQSAILVLISLLLGGIAGEAARLDDRLTAFGDWVEARFSRPGAQSPRSAPLPGAGVGDTPPPAPTGSKYATAVDGRKRASFISQGFVTASLVFCVGPMTILGAFQDGLTGAYDTLAVKSVLDGFTAVALASSLGWGVGLASLTVLVYQGTLTAGASWAKPFLTDPVMLEMTATGGLLIVAIGLNLLGIMRIRVANMLPALAIAPALVALLGRV
jgi:uncharacterized protein